MDTQKTPEQHLMDMDACCVRRDEYLRLMSLALALQDTLNSLITLDRRENDYRLQALWHSSQVYAWLDNCQGHALTQETDCSIAASQALRAENEGR